MSQETPKEPIFLDPPLVFEAMLLGCIERFLQPSLPLFLSGNRRGAMTVDPPPPGRLPLPRLIPFTPLAFFIRWFSDLPLPFNAPALLARSLHDFALMTSPDPVCFPLLYPFPPISPQCPLRSFALQRTASFSLEPFLVFATNFFVSQPFLFNRGFVFSTLFF